jgi:cell wall-associated NlpC family hydrolase
MKQIAQKFLNAPYIWGGKTPFGIDCSGLIQQIFKICGYKLYRDAWMQFNQGNPVDSIENSRPGDLAFFENDQGKVTHVGIIMEDNRIFHASGFVKIDYLDEKGIYSKELSGYSHNLKGIKRILKL